LICAIGSVTGWSPLDDWFCGAGKGSVYTNRPATLHDLKQEVSDYIQAVPHETCRKVGQNFGVRINACLSEGHTSRMAITRILWKCQFQTLDPHLFQK